MTLSSGSNLPEEKESKEQFWKEIVKIDRDVINEFAKFL